MNPIHQSLSSLLRNPALQPEQAGKRTEQRAAEKPATGETLKMSDAARQSLARSNAAAALPGVKNLAEAQGLSRLVRESLNSAGAMLVNAHGRIDPQAAGNLLR